MWRNNIQINEFITEKINKIKELIINVYYLYIYIEIK